MLFLELLRSQSDVCNMKACQDVQKLCRMCQPLMDCGGISDLGLSDPFGELLHLLFSIPRSFCFGVARLSRLHRSSPWPRSWTATGAP